MRVTRRFRRTTLPHPLPEKMELSSVRTLKFNIRGGFAIHAYQGVDSLTEAEMDEVDSKLPRGVRFARPPRDEYLTLTTGTTVRVEIYLDEARQYSSNPHLTNEEDQELRCGLRRRGITPRWWSEVPDED